MASHFPVLSEASRVAGGGIPYAGDIVNRAELEAGLRAAGRPTVVLSGHIHVRCSTDDGTLLQFTVGALIESPFDATIVELDPAALEVRRTSRGRRACTVRPGPRRRRGAPALGRTVARGRR